MAISASVQIITLLLLISDVMGQRSIHNGALCVQQHILLPFDSIRFDCTMYIHTPPNTHSIDSAMSIVFGPDFVTAHTDSKRSHSKLRTARLVNVLSVCSVCCARARARVRAWPNLSKFPRNDWELLFSGNRKPINEKIVVMKIVRKIFFLRFLI